MDSKQTYLILAGTAVASIAIGILMVTVSNKQEAATGGLPGLQTTQADWQPEYSGLAERIRTLKLPPPGKETYHVHARLAVYANGKQIPVPTNIGLNPSGGTFSGLHTHDNAGVIHLEADQPFEAKMSDFFAVWGVKLTNTEMGGYVNEGTKTVQLFVNGNRVENPADYSIKSKDSLVLGYGEPRSFPTAWPTPFPTDL